MKKVTLILHVTNSSIQVLLIGAIFLPRSIFSQIRYRDKNIRMKRRKSSKSPGLSGLSKIAPAAAAATKFVTLLLLLLAFISSCTAQFGFEDEDDEYKGRLIGELF